MKKILLFLFFAIWFINLSAQKIAFMGIPLGQSTDYFDLTLRQKGFSKEFRNNEKTTYRGLFWKFFDALITVEAIHGEVHEVWVTTTKISLATYNELVGSFNNKYGKYYEKNSLDFPSHLWKVEGGGIQTLYSDGVVMITYFDKNCSLYNTHFVKRNVNDDL